MTTFKLSTKYKKSITEKQFWTKDGKTIIYSTGWRWGYARYDDEPDVDMNLEDNEEVNIYDLGDVIDHSFDDGCWADWEFPDDMDEEEQEQILVAYDENYDDGLYELGWECNDTEVWFSGPLELEVEND